MGRVLPSGRVFGEAVDLPNVQFAQREKFGGRLQEVIESPVTDLAVAGISRIADELDYRDRLNAEKQRVAAAQIEERKATAALTALQEQMEARGAAMAAAKEREAQIAAASEAQALLDDRADLAGIQQGEAIDAARGVVQQIAPGGPHTPFLARGMDPGQQFLAGLAQAEDPGAYYAAWQSRHDPTLTAFRGTQEGGDLSAEVLASGSHLRPGQAPPIPEEVTEDQLDVARARLAAAKEAAAVPMAFVPRTLADYRFQVRELERALVGAETQEEKVAIIDQLRNTMETARGAVDVQPDGLMEAVTGVAGKKAQKVAFEGMSTGEKEFLKQMYDASKEKRDAAREARAVAKEAHEAEMRPLRKRKLDAEMKRAEKRLRSGAGSKQLKRADRAILAYGANFIQDHQHYKNKTGPYSLESLVPLDEQATVAADDALLQEYIDRKWRKRTGPLINADIDTLEMDMNVAGLSPKGGKVADKSIKALRQKTAATVRAGRQEKAREEGRKRAKKLRESKPPPATITKRIARLEGDNALLNAKDEMSEEEQQDLIANLAELAVLRSPQGPAKSDVDALRKAARKGE